MPEPIKRYQEFVDKIYDPNAKLDWRPESWLGERAESVTGPKYTKKDVQIFRSHVPEYKKIEKAARKNGTWLQMSDGTIWTGDPREWVMMQSEAFKKNYQENPWYTGQAEWATKATLPDGTTVDTDKVKRARYHNGEMWFSDDAGYAQYFADAVGEGGIGRRNENYETSDVRGKVFLSAIPKKGNYRYLYNDSKGDLWWDMPYDLTDNDIVRSKKIGKSKNDKWVIKSEGLNLKTDDIVNHSKKLGDDGIFMFNVMDGPVRRNIGNLPYYAVPNTGINEEMDPEGPSNSMHLEIPVNEFISQPGFTEKIKFIRGNNGNFDPNTDDKYSAIFKIDSPLFVKKGGRIHIKKKNRGKFTAAAKRAGMGVQEFARHVLANKDKYSSTLVKRANFARNSKKFKHENGGILKAQEGTGNLWTPHPLSPVGIALNQAKIMAKMKGEQQHLPPGVKEVVGPDGKKIAIRTEQPLVPLEKSIAEWLPGTGDVAEVGYIANDVKNGRYGSAALAAGLMLLPGNARKIFSKSRIDPIFINGKINQVGIQEGLFGGKRSAESFMGSQTYKDAVAHDIALAKRAFGYDINPVVDDKYIKMPVKVEGASLGPHDAGLMYPNPNTNNPADDRILVDVGKHKTVNDLAATIFHENLHHGRFKTIDPQGNTIFTEIYHPEKVNPTLDFYRWKLKHLFKPEVEIPQELLEHYKYLTGVEIPHNEGATNVLELGFLGNARAKSGYPGAQEVQRILDEVRKANPQHAYTIDLLNMKKPKRVWEAMTGQYEDGGKLTDDDYRERVKKFLLWRTVGPEESTYIKNFKM